MPVNRCDRLGGVTISPFLTVHSTPSLAFQPVRSLPLNRLTQPSADFSSAQEKPIVASPSENVVSVKIVNRDLLMCSCSRCGVEKEFVDQVKSPGRPGAARSCTCSVPSIFMRVASLALI